MKPAHQENKGLRKVEILHCTNAKQLARNPARFPKYILVISVVVNICTKTTAFLTKYKVVLCHEPFLLNTT